MSISCQAILFDLDGTLINSRPAVERVWKAWALRNDMPWETLEPQLHGRRAIDTMRSLRPHLPQPEEADRLTEEEIADTDGVVAIPGALDFLAQLPRHRWGIVTSCPLRLAEARMRAAGIPCPDVLVTADLITHGKPDPEGFLLGAKKIGFAAASCLVFEDAAAGIEAGHRAGMQVIAVTSGSMNFPRIKSLADYRGLAVRISDQGLFLEL